MLGAGTFSERGELWAEVHAVFQGTAGCFGLPGAGAASAVLVFGSLCTCYGRGGLGFVSGPWVSSRRWEDLGPQGGSVEQPLVLWGESQGLAGPRGASSKLCSPKVTPADLCVDVCQEVWGGGWKAFV